MYSRDFYKYVGFVMLDLLKIKLKVSVMIFHIGSTFLLQGHQDTVLDES